MSHSDVKTNIHYRPEIDGLRAIAVLSVVLFHLNEIFLPGGFIGVDIFFVISGFLISNHLLSDIKSSNFAFSRFYLKRARRILPALYVCILFTIVLSVLFLLPFDVKRAVKTATEALVYKANYYFAYYVDYFAPSTTEFPFLHLWSLSVEEQFYFVLPAILFSVAKFTSILKINLKKYLSILLICIFFASIIWTEYCLNQENLKKLAFYDSFSRASEFLVGVFLAVFNLKITKKYLAEVASTLGFMILIASLYLIHPQTRFPGWWALLPCLGTALIISSAAEKTTFIGKFLSLKPVVFIGVISYSLYLYHWPIMAIVRYTNSQIFFTPVQIFWIFAVSVILAILSWRFVELPFRKPSQDSTSKSLVKFFVIPTIGLVILLRVFMFATESRWYRGENYEKIANTFLYLEDDQYCHGRFDEAKCILGDLSIQPKALLIGDSNAGHYQPFLDEVGKIQNFSFVARTSDACIPVITRDQHLIQQITTDPKCAEQIAWSESNFNRFDTIIFAASWDGYVGKQSPNPIFEKEIINTINLLIANKKQVIFLELIPDCLDLPAFYRSRFTVKNVLMDETSFRQTIQANCNKRSIPTNAYLKNLAETHGAIFLPALEDFQNQVGKMPFIGDDYYYKDGSHLNQFGSSSMGRWSGANSERFKFLAEKNIN